MFKRIGSRAITPVFLLLVLLGACNKGDSAGKGFTSEDNLLSYVPADTPFLLATGKPLPDDLLDKLEPKIDKVLRSYQIVLREAFRSRMAKNTDNKDSAELARMSALIDELSTLMSIEGMRAAGLERDSNVVFFGNGLLPVMRIALSDPALFDAAIGRIEKAAGETMDIAEIDGDSYRYVGNDDGSLAIATLNGDAVFTFIPAGFNDAQKGQLLGLTKPAKNIASTTTLTDIAKTYDYTDYYIGFIDLTRIAATFVDGPTGLDAALLKSMEDDAPVMSNVCKAEVRDMVAIAPRMVFGYNEVSSDAINGSFVIEMRSDIAAGLKPLSAMVPGLGVDAGGLLSMGFSFNLLAIREFYEARLDAMEKDPYECEYFADLQAGVAKGREILNQPIPPFVYGMRGFNAVVDDISDFDLASSQPPDDIDASIVFAMDDAQTMVAMGAMFSPELASLNLNPDGKAVLLDLPQVQAVGKAVYAAMLEDAVAISVGADAESRVSSVLTAKSGEPPPMFSMSMDAGRYYGLIGDAMVIDQQDEDSELSPEAREALRDAMTSIAEMYDRMAFDLRFTDRGVELASRVTLKD